MNGDRILIAGTGAMACLFGARLAASGAAVTLFGTWADGVAALASDGIRLIEADGTERAFPVEARHAPEGDAPAVPPARICLVLVKSWQTARVAGQLGTLLAPGGIALTLQNGLGNRERLAAALGGDRVSAGSATLGATLLGPGIVRAAGKGVVSVGEEPGLAPLRALLAAAGFELAVVPDIDSLLWGKVVINAGINPLTALLRVPNGVLLERPSARQLLRDTVIEAANIARTAGNSLPYADPVAITEGVARRTAANRSSMLQDVSRGAPTEIDAICGAIAQTGAAAGVPSPINETLWRLVAALGGSAL